MNEASHGFEVELAAAAEALLNSVALRRNRDFNRVPARRPNWDAEATICSKCSENHMGGQTGADRLDDRYKVIEHSPAHILREPRRNIEKSDGTMIFSLDRVLSGGTKLTLDLAKKLGKPVLQIYDTRHERIPRGSGSSDTRHRLLALDRLFFYFTSR
jgi:hypothetical protein